MELKVQTSGKQLTVWTLCSALWSELEMQTGAWLVWKVTDRSHARRDVVQGDVESGERAGCWKEPKEHQKLSVWLKSKSYQIPQVQQ